MDRLRMGVLHDVHSREITGSNDREVFNGGAISTTQNAAIGARESAHRRLDASVSAVSGNLGEINSSNYSIAFSVPSVTPTD